MVKKLIQTIYSHPFVIILCLLVLGFLLRYQSLFGGDFNYSLDQARDLLLTNDIIKNNHIILIGARAGIGGVFHGPLWLYFLTPFFILFQGDPFLTLTIPHILVNLFPILLGFILVRKQYTTALAVLYSFFIATSSLLSSQWYNTSNAHVMFSLMILFQYSLIEILRKKISHIYLLALVIGLSFHFESAFAIFMVIYTLLALFVYKVKLPIKHIALSFLLFVASIINFIIFELKYSFLMTKSILTYMGSKPLHDYEQYGQLSYRIVDRGKLFLEYFSFPFQNPISQLKWIWVFILILVVIYAWRIVKNSKSTSALLFKTFALFPLFYYGLFIFYKNPIWIHYQFALIINACFVISCALYILYTKSSKKSIVLGLLFIQCMFTGTTLIQNYIMHPSTKSTYKAQLKIGEYVFKDAQGKSFGYLVYDPGQLTYNMDYLLYYLNTKNNNIAINNKQDITYLIMKDPDSWNKNAHVVFKKDIVKTSGKILSKKYFKNPGITVEKIKIASNEPDVDPMYFQNLFYR